MTTPRPRVTKRSGMYLITCETCTGGNLIDAFLATGWLKTHTIDDALWWANWHAAEHARLHCSSCDRHQKIPTVTVLDRQTVRAGDRLFARQGPGKWREVAA